MVRRDHLLYSREADAHAQGKMNYYVADQSKLETLPQEKIAELEKQLKTTDEELKTAAGDLRTATNGTACSSVWLYALDKDIIDLTKIKSTPKDNELDVQIADMTAQVGLDASLLDAIQ